jgi:cytochrome P450
MSDFNPFDPAFLENPYPAYRMLRETKPVYRHTTGAYLLTRYDDVATLLRDPRFGKGPLDKLLSARFADGSAGVPPGATSIMLFKDPPDHTRLRALVNKAFTPRVVEQMRAHIQAIVDELLDRVAGRTVMDVITDLAYPLPVRVISEMLGVPREDTERVKGWSADIARTLDAILTPTDPEIVARGISGFKGFTAYFRELCAERRAAPKADLLSALIAADEQGDVLDENELLGTCVMLYVAGHDTTVNLIGNGTLALLNHPDELRRVTEDPALVEPAVEELLRYDTPVQRAGRVVLEDIELRGGVIPKGSLVVGLVGAANRDPGHFAEPDRLDVTRSPNKHLAFGWGIHFCLGAPLARLEGQTAIRTLLARHPGIKRGVEPPQWRPSATLRGLGALPVVLS